MDEIDMLNDSVKRHIGENDQLTMNVMDKRAIEKTKLGDVYQRRSMWLLVVYLFVTALFLSEAPSWSSLFFSMLWMFFYGDFYGGILHVVLDTPAFLDNPLVGQACLEFQWHHVIPQDIVLRPFLSVCGDLNTIVAVHLFAIGLMSNFSDPLTNTIGASKLFMAYLGQWSHRQAHMRGGSLGGSSLGTLPKHVHAEHHVNYTSGFTILNGLTDGIVSHLFKRFPPDTYRISWLTAFVVLTLFDVVTFGTVARYLNSAKI